MGITVGMKGVAETLCEREDTAKEVGSGDLLVYATPCMVALMEGAHLRNAGRTGSPGRSGGHRRGGKGHHLCRPCLRRSR